MQFFTAYICKATDRISCSRKAFVNLTTYYGFLVSIVILVLCTFVPGIHEILSSNNWPLWLVPVALVGGFLSLALEVIRRIVLRQMRASKTKVRKF